MRSDCRSWPRRLLEGLYGLYAWLAFSSCVLFGLFVTLLVPGQRRRSRLIAAAARASFFLGGVRPQVEGLDNLPEGDCVVVANHASYVDGPLLKGHLPARFSFVVKGEMRNIPIAHFFLRRAGCKFVERFESGASSRDARQIVKAAQGGESLALFPEGTFKKQAGLAPFRAGAFVAAIRGGMPVVPVVISGSREMLPSERLLPRPVKTRIDILTPIWPDEPAFDHHRDLARSARQRILSVLDEPDLDTHSTADRDTLSGESL